MDPLLLEVLRFRTAILAGGLVTVIAQRVAFQHALKLEDRRGARNDAALRRALIAEIRENMRRLTGLTIVPIVRSAWDAARTLPLPGDVFDAIARGYACGTEAHEVIALITSKMPTGFVLNKSKVEAGVATGQALALQKAHEARRFYAYALEQLGEVPEADTNDGPAT